MKTVIPTAIMVAVMILWAAAAAVKAGPAGRAFSEAAGKYKGKAGGNVSSSLTGTTVPIRKSGSFVKIPRGKGRFVANFGGLRIKGRFRKATVRQGGRKIVFVGTGTLPPKLTAPLMAGPGTGTLRAIAKLRGKSPKLKAKGSFGIDGLIKVTTRFRGKM